MIKLSAYVSISTRRKNVGNQQISMFGVIEGMLMDVDIICEYLMDVYIAKQKAGFVQLGYHAFLYCREFHDPVVQGRIRRWFHIQDTHIYGYPRTTESTIFHFSLETLFPFGLPLHG